MSAIQDKLPRRMVVSAPGAAYFEAADLAAHNLTAPADRERAHAQHRALCAALVAAGIEVITIPALAGHPNSVFVQDTALGAPDGFIRLRMGLPSRRGEPAWMAEALAGAGAPEIGRITAPATVEGGDVILAGDVAFVGRSSRTNAAGVRQITARLAPLGYEVRVADVPSPSLHIGGMMSAVGPRHILACEGVFPPEFFASFEVIAIPQSDFISGNVIGLGAGYTIAAQSNPHAITALRAASFTVQPLDLSEFVKGAGGPSCLVLPLF
ncbi:MAG: dimethylarginine dimethylaminohydrolase family protein [Anaerolineales bacterium]